MNVLINAYAISPSWGSEQGMGWNWVINIARFCNVFVITEGQWRAEIESALSDLPQRNNIHFYYNPISERVRKMCWNQGDWRFYFHYRRWQKKTLKIALGIIKDRSIDIIHQLNMIGFREPGLLWKVPEIPFVWGPVGGMELFPANFIKGAGLKYCFWMNVKNVINDFQRKYQPNVIAAIRRASCILAATEGVKFFLKNKYQKDSILLNETGCLNISMLSRVSDKNHFKIIWVGKFDYRKQLGLALEIVSMIKDCPGLEFHVVGSGSEKEVLEYRAMAEELGLSNIVTWHGKVPNESIKSLFLQSDILLFTSISDATSTVVLEAITYNLPVICFNICGFGPIVNDIVGKTVDMTDRERAAGDFAYVIKHLYDHRDELEKYADACNEMKEKLSYERKAQKVMEIYKNILANDGKFKI